MSAGHQLRQRLLGRGLMKIISDLPGLHLSWLRWSQENTSNRQLLIMSPLKSMSLLQVKSSCVSSAYNTIFAPWFSTRLARGVIYRLKRMGLRMELWGTPTSKEGIGAANGGAHTDGDSLKKRKTS